MAKDRQELHKELQSILGNKNVYFQPPANIRLTYPCIVYKLDRLDARPADNKPYKVDRAYSLTLMERDPDSTVAERLMFELNARVSTKFTYENLYHTKLTLYY